ncbi:BnaC06g23670D [Brassica napus]|uniref:BnaC06g23670D protein n=1 Tax=Brassica napus TaxID=3708 RepID=A0A078F9H5_BRANA|nr:BnaC06g23670D [Brassica napus]
MANDHVSSVLKSLFLLLLVFLSQHHADSASIVEFLPGFEGPLPFELETGRWMINNQLAGYYS